MSIDRLIAVVRPPARGIEFADPAFRDDIERKLGVGLPSDYWEMIRAYGIGRFVVEDKVVLEVENASSSFFFDSLGRNTDFLLQMKNENEEQVPFGVYPERPGLFQWGHDDNGFNYCWLTKGDANNWPIEITNSRDVSFQEVKLSLTDFLADLFSHRFASAPWGNYFDGARTIFVSDADIA